MMMRAAHAYRRLNDALRKDAATFAVGKSKVVSNDQAIADNIKKQLNVCTAQCVNTKACKCLTNHKIDAPSELTVLGVDLRLVTVSHTPR